MKLWTAEELPKKYVEGLFMKSKKLLSFVLLTAIASSLFVGCSKKEPAKVDNQSTQTKEFVELTWYYYTNPTVDQDKVFEKANEIIKSKINAKVNFKPIENATYEQKMQTKYAAQDAGDITWTASWKNSYSNNVAKGSFIEIDDLINKYGPNIKKLLTPEQWNALKIKGKIYGVPGLQIMTTTDESIVRKDLASKYNFDTSKVTKYTDYEPLMESIRKSEPADVVFNWVNPGKWGNLGTYYGFDGINNVGSVKYDDKNTKVVNLYESKEFEEYCNVVKRWRDKGYIAKDSMTLKNQDAEIKAMKIVGGIGGNHKPGGAAESSAKWGTEVESIAISPTIIKTGGIQTTINAITSNSKNPERAMMFLELVNSDKDLFNLLSFGIENEHYKKIDANTIELVNNKDPKYSAYNWVFGNVFNGYLIKGQEKDTWEKTKEMNKNAKPSVMLGFTFDPSPVKTEIAQLQSVIDEYLPGLGCGAVDIAQKLPEFRQKLKVAGADKVVAETQKQVDEWKASNK